jgi:hypothetical protein
MPKHREHKTKNRHKHKAAEAITTKRAYKKLIEATSGGNVCKVQKILSRLKQQGIDINTLTCDRKSGVTPLHIAALLGYANIVENLLENGMNPGCIDRNKNTPLHLAVSRQHRDVTVLLLSFGADSRVMNEFNESPLSLGILDVLGPGEFDKKTTTDTGDDTNWNERLWQEMSEESEHHHTFVQWQDEEEQTDYYGPDDDSWMDNIAKQAHAMFADNRNKAEQRAKTRTRKEDNSRVLEAEQEKDRAWRARTAQGTADAKKNEDDKWIKFSKSYDTPIQFTDVPWPSGPQDNILNIKNTSDKDKKIIIRAALLRWHPDKFIQVFGGRLAENDKEKIVNKVKEITQQINAYSKDATTSK